MFIIGAGGVKHSLFCELEHCKVLLGNDELAGGAPSSEVVLRITLAIGVYICYRRLYE